MPDRSDPRVFFAAERTLLAWLRTGVSIVGLGFVVSRFGLFLRAVGHHPAGVAPLFGSTEIGVGLVILGAVVIGGATWQHGRYIRRLPADDRPVGYWGGFAVWVSGAAAVASVILGVYLLKA